MRDPKLLLNNNLAGRRRISTFSWGVIRTAAFGNSNGDRQMLEYTQAGGGASLEMLVLHDDAVREYAYGPARACRTPRSGPLVRRCTTRQRRRAGP